ncbi:RTA1 like protein-domain-containing protein [Nemania sp. FL0916]|nr:RTA1 like protein-domain-containing protein [Nemania sp. FL0916]
MASSDICASVICSLGVLYQPPGLAGNATLLASFASLIPITLALTFKYKSLVFPIFLATGLALEVLGYVGRLGLHYDVDSGPCITLFLIGTSLGPICIFFSMVWTVPHIIGVFGEEYRAFMFVRYPGLFAIPIAISLLLQFVGSLHSTSQDDPDAALLGTQVLLGGLSILLFALTIFIAHSILTAIALRARQRRLDMSFSCIYAKSQFKSFIFVLAVATTLIMLRTLYRTIQLAGGLKSPTARTETLFLLLDGAAVLVAAVLLVAYFPARILRPFSVERLIIMPLETPLSESESEAQLSISRPSPTYHRSPTASTTDACSPDKPSHSSRASHTEMVDHDNLW